MNVEPLYFEAHVTLEPPRSEHDRCVIAEVCNEHGFRPAKLLMQKGSELMLSNLDAFATTRGAELVDVLTRTRAVTAHLRSQGFTVYRAKLEVAILDEIYVPKSERLSAVSL